MSGTATNGSDYTLTGITGQVSLPAGQTSAAVKLKAKTDQLTEGTETADHDFAARQRLQGRKEQTGDSFHP